MEFSETRGIAREFAYAVTSVAIEFHVCPTSLTERDPEGIAKDARWILGWILHRVHGWSTWRIRDFIEGHGAALGANIRSIDMKIRCQHNSTRATLCSIIARMETASQGRLMEIRAREVERTA